ncbi:uncharacterized protein LOC131065548 isoform X2 [Cryptomeria japonica]|uniref:uncharacterized protein LOC131065548 isoform X2 n=1 Tax=Cryptomeria japonica TaxID=3369 RepID=UPI0025ACAE93|nr:uncharacterized protein LOC131065548 isoform X2 [Cryptomeria japonica]
MQRRVQSFLSTYWILPPSEAWSSHYLLYKATHMYLTGVKAAGESLKNIRSSKQATKPGSPCTSILLTFFGCFDEMGKEEIFFIEETRRGCTVIDLDELVQHSGNILPRLRFWEDNENLKIYGGTSSRKKIKEHY